MQTKAKSGVGEKVSQETGVGIGLPLKNDAAGSTKSTGSILDASYGKVREKESRPCQTRRPDKRGFEDQKGLCPAVSMLSSAGVPVACAIVPACGNHRRKPCDLL